MKLICLNTWGGHLYKPLINFIKDNSKDTDIFCLQEVFDTTSNIKTIEERRMNLYDEISKILRNHQGYFAPSLKDYVIVSQSRIVKTNFNLYSGLSIFVKKQINVDSNGDFFVHKDIHTFNPDNLNTIPKNAQFITFTKSGKKFTICNLHGIWLKEGKEDSPERLKQSEKINEFLKKMPGGKILCGDLNLEISTQSIKILEKNMRNLIKEYKISTTRNSNFPGNEKFADYVFISPDIKVNDFAVPNIKVSDHLPMILEFT